MPSTKNFPFRRIAVDHLILGSSRVWWQLDPTFRPELTCHFQLQHSHTGTDDALDWKNVGDPVVDAYYAYDSNEQRIYGKTLNSFYRVTLTVGAASYVSEAASVFGELPEHDLLTAREIIRKEKLRDGFIATPGFLLKRMRYGAPCPRCRDVLTDETTETTCPICNGTGYRIGYHPAVPLCVDKSPETIAETLDPSMRGAVSDEELMIRVCAFPMLQKEDIWVDGETDQRWAIDVVKFVAVRRSMPIVMSVTMKLLPFSHIAYKLPLCPADVEVPEAPGPGDGCVTVDHDFGGTDSYRTLTAAGDPVSGVQILVFTLAVYDANAGKPPATLAAAATVTLTDGRWESPLQLNPGDYVVVASKAGEYGPDVADLLVPRPTDESSAGDSFWA